MQAKQIRIDENGVPLAKNLKKKKIQNGVLMVIKVGTSICYLDTSMAN